MSAGNVISNLTQSLNCSGGKCDCCFQSKVQQQDLSNQLNSLSQRVAKIESYINQLDGVGIKMNQDVVKLNNLLRILIRVIKGFLK